MKHLGKLFFFTLMTAGVTTIASVPVSFAASSISAQSPLMTSAPIASINQVQSISVDTYGAKGDGVTDDTGSIQAAVDSASAHGGGIVLVPDGTYMINTEKSIQLKSNVTLQLSTNAILKAIPNGLEKSYILRLLGVSNVKVTGGFFEGDRPNHTGTSGEWGMGIGILGSHNISVSDVNISDCWGDGVYIGDYMGACSNVSLNDVTSENNRRNGITIISGHDVQVANCQVADSNDGIDIEPNYQSDALDEITINKLTTSNNRDAGISVGLNKLNGSSQDISINITGHHDSGSDVGILVSKYAVNGQINVIDSSWEANKYRDVYIKMNRAKIYDDTFLSNHVDLNFLNSDGSAPLNIVTSSLPVGSIGQAYNAQLDCSGGQQGYTWATNSVVLPKGLKLSSQGIITGTPQIAGTYTINVVVLDAEHNRRSVQLALILK